MKFKVNLAACLGLAAAMGSGTAYADTTQDKAITNQVKESIAKNPDLGTDITVSTKNGVVYLKGKTTTILAKSHAEELAKAVPGVQQVVVDIGTEK
jgi:osmotically-inducible protein OsmY